MEEDTHGPTNSPFCDPTGNLALWTLFFVPNTINKPVLIDAADPERALTRGRVTDLVGSLAGAFEPEVAVCLHLPNDVLYPVLMLSIWANGGMWTGSNIAYTEHELRHHLLMSGTCRIITMPEQLPTVAAAVLDVWPEVEVIIFSDILRKQATPEERVEGFRSLHDIQRPFDDTNELAVASDLEGYIAALQSTSGTAGLPKVSIRTHKSLMLESMAIEDRAIAKPYEEGAEQPYEIRRLFCTPIFHAFSTPLMAINSIRYGHTTYIMRRFDDTFAQKVFDFQITETAAAPPMLMKLCEQNESHHLLQSLRKVWSGGAPLSQDLRSRFLGIFANPLRIVQVWGMTEGGWFTTFQRCEDDSTGSVGRPLKGVEIKVDRSKDGLQLRGDKKTGELLVRSEQLMVGYLRDESATSDAFDGDWLRTGDVGYIEDGKVFLVDRAKDLIKVNGWQVSSAEIEGVLLEHEAVKDVAAVSAGSGVDEHPLVVIVPRFLPSPENMGLALSIMPSLEDLLRTRLARYKVAKIEFGFVESIPRNSSGKILRQELKSWAEEQGLLER
ncbi:uncharacterized protein LTR77_011085 [Saxophila tyrrhenica]|uniref:Acetyl-CoA synthetase-like protein n=1 Tax=Saxophila tyrrhenica TaxID=1690608 RepID=A0AAV9NXD8_9PEZI|nr:hypothetical protein LTR77_011085 [Saxophila tyrrhenica]